MCEDVFSWMGWMITRPEDWGRCRRNEAIRKSKIINGIGDEVGGSMPMRRPVNTDPRLEVSTVVRSCLQIDPSLFL